MNPLLVICYWLSGRFRKARRFDCLILLLSAGLSVMAQEAAPAVPVDPIAAALGAYRAGQLETAETMAREIRNPPAKYFVQACIEQAKGDPKSAIQTLVKVTVRYPNDPIWTVKSELLSAVLYMELGMLDAAEVTARQVQTLHEGTGFAKQAAALSVQIEELKKEIEGSVE